MAILIFIHIHVPSSYEFCNCPFLKRLHYKLDKQMAFHQYESWYASSCHYHISLAWDKKDKPICLDQCKLGLGDSEKMIKCEWMILTSSTMLICEINEISRNSNKQREIWNWWLSLHWFQCSLDLFCIASDLCIQKLFNFT